MKKIVIVLLAVIIGISLYMANNNLEQKVADVIKRIEKLEQTMEAPEWRDLGRRGEEVSQKDTINNLIDRIEKLEKAIKEQKPKAQEPQWKDLGKKESEASKEVSEMERKLSRLEDALTDREKIQLRHPLDEASIKAILLGLGGSIQLDTLELIYENLWRKTFEWTTLFESLDGFGQAGSAGATIELDGDKLLLRTGATSSNFARVYKQPTYQGVITFYKKNGFRTNFLIDSVANVEAWITMGSSDPTQKHYGFKIENNILKGVVGNGSAETYKDLLTIEANKIYNIEARYYPGEKVIFYVKGPTAPATYNIYAEPIGIITTNLPPNTPVVNLMLMDIRVQTNAAAEKQLYMSFWQFIQSREYNQ